MPGLLLSLDSFAGRMTFGCKVLCVADEPAEKNYPQKGSLAFVADIVSLILRVERVFREGFGLHNHTIRRFKAQLGLNWQLFFQSFDKIYPQMSQLLLPADKKAPP